MHPKILGVISIASISLAVPVRAHHSHANYIEMEWISLEGTVQEVHWMNPHTWIYLQATDASGSPAAWALEGASVASLQRAGWTKDSLSVGDTLAVRCHPLKDGSRGCLMGFIRMADGSEKEFD